MIKKSLLFGFLFLMFSTLAFAAIRNIQDNFKLIYNVIDTSGNHVGSETITLAIQKASNGYWYDFSDDTFKTSGWTNKTTNLTEDSTNGLYYYTFNPPTSETTAEEYIFLVDNASTTYGDHQALVVTYQNIGTSVLATSDNIGINWANVSNPTTVVALTGTTWSTGQTIASVSGAVGSVTNAVTTTQASADLVWSSIANNRLLTAGTNIVLAKGTGITGFNEITAASVWTSATRTLTAGDNIVLAKGTGVTGFNDITAASVWTVAERTLTNGGYSGLTATDIDNIWDEVQTGHTIPFSFGKYLDAQVSLIGGSSLTNDSIADAVWNETLSGHLTSGTTGKKLSEMPTPYDISP